MKKIFNLFSLWIVLALLGCQNQSDHKIITEKIGVDSTVSINRKLVMRTLAAIDKNDFAELDKCLADSFRFAGASIKVPLKKDEFYASIKEHFAAFPDWHHSIDEMLFDHSKVFIQTTRKGTQKGEFLGLKPTNIEITNSACYLMTIDNNRVSRCWALEDRLGVVKALGMELKRKSESK
jgi:predicted ester cyclase